MTRHKLVLGPVLGAALLLSGCFGQVEHTEEPTPVECVFDVPGEDEGDCPADERCTPDGCVPYYCPPGAMVGGYCPGVEGTSRARAERQADACGSETSWIEPVGDGWRAVCGDADGVSQ